MSSNENPRFGYYSKGSEVSPSLYLAKSNETWPSNLSNSNEKVNEFLYSLCSSVKLSRKAGNGPIKKKPLLNLGAFCWPSLRTTRNSGGHRLNPSVGERRKPWRKEIELFHFLEGEACQP